MRRHPSLAAIALALPLLGMTLTALAPVSAAPESGWPTPRPPGSPCVAEAMVVSAPHFFLLGETVEVTMAVHAVCAGEPVLGDLALVIDASEQVSSGGPRRIRDAAVRLIDVLEAPGSGNWRVAVVSFAGDTRRECALTDNFARARTCVDRATVRRAGGSPGSRLDLGITAGLRALQAGRRAAATADLSEVMIVMSNGNCSAGCGQAVRAAGKVKADSVLVVAVCFDDDCDVRCMDQVASSTRYFFVDPVPREFYSMFQQVRDRLQNIWIGSVVVTETISPTVAFVDGSAAPPPKSIDAAHRVLVWETGRLPKDGVTLTYRVRPIIPGKVPVSGGAVGRLVDNKGRPGVFAFPATWVTALQAFAMPTPRP